MYYLKAPLVGLGELGQAGMTCEQMDANAATFQRLSQKKDKKAATRASALQQSQYWANAAAACRAKIASPPVVTPGVTGTVTYYDQYGNAVNFPAGTALPPGYSNVPISTGGGSPVLQPLQPPPGYGGPGYTAPLPPTYGGGAPYLEPIPEDYAGEDTYAGGGAAPPSAYSTPQPYGVPSNMMPSASFPPSSGGGFETYADVVAMPQSPMFPQTAIPGAGASPQAGGCQTEQFSVPTSDQWGSIDVIQVVCASPTPQAQQAGGFGIQSSADVEAGEIAMMGMGRFIG